MPTLLCVPIMVQDEPTASADARAARDAGADMVEFRIDEFFSGVTGADGNLDSHEVTAILRLVAASPLPCIVTCRSAEEGGRYEGDEMARVALYERLGTARPGGCVLGEHPPQYLDIEHASYTRSANIQHKVNLAVDYPAMRREPRPGLILSMHDLEGRPPDLLRRVSAMQAQEAARVIKIAYTGRSVRDNLELFDLLAENAAGRPTIALAMGRFGLMSRVLAPKFGGFLTFASLRPQSTTAPGQPTIAELLEVYRFRSIGPRTRVYGVIGWPVEHSLSPLVHNAGFESLTTDDWEKQGGRRHGSAAGKVAAHDAVYLPLPVPPEYEHFKATLSALIDHPRLDFCGCSVTVPHKQHLVRFARERMEGADELTWSIDDGSETSGAANTLVVERDRTGNARIGSLLNTDGPAASEVLAGALGGSLADKRILLIGAGGAARAIASELLGRGAEVVVCNRTPAAAESLVREIGSAPRTQRGRGSIAAASLSDTGGERCDALVNCTPVGMAGGPEPGKSPVSVTDLASTSPGAVVMETVYRPLLTPLLEQASLAGLRTIDGLAMFVRQAGAQFTAWTGAPAPLRLFERICREELQAK